MQKILGLDLGTNSIGWAIVEKKTSYNIENGQRKSIDAFRLVDQGVRIFTEGVKIDQGSESSRASERTGFRSARRLKFRRKLRKYETLKVLVRNNMCPLQMEELISWRKSNFKKYPTSELFLKWLRTDETTDYNPYRLRAEAATKRIGLYDLGRAFYHMAQRRGFLSNRLDASETNIIEDSQAELEERIISAQNTAELQRTLDEFFTGFNLKEDENKPLKALAGGLKRILKHKEIDAENLKKQCLERLYKKENLGPVKQAIENLTDKITQAGCSTLGEYFYTLYSSNKHAPSAKIRTNYTARLDHYLNEFRKICKVQGISSSVQKELYQAIFYQRPLKSQKGLVGKCSFEKKKPRCPSSHPLFEEYRMFSFINNIRLKSQDEDEWRPLNSDERNAIIPKFLRKSKPAFPFEDLANTLGTDLQFNYRMNQTVVGMPTRASLKNLFGPEYEMINFNYPVDSGKKERSAVDYLDLWHVLFSFDSKEHLFNYAIEKLKLDEKKAKQFASIRLKTDYANLSLKAIRMILPYLKQGLVTSHAILMANLESVVDSEKWKNKAERSEIEMGIASIVQNESRSRKQVSVVNAALRKFREEYDNSHSSYNLDKHDLEALNERISSVFGERFLSQLTKTEQTELFEDTARMFESQLRSKKFLPQKRIDQKVMDFLCGANKDGVIYCSNPNRLELLYHPSDIDVFEKSEADADGNILLGDPRIPAIKNPMAMRTMHQLRKLVNSLLMEGLIDPETKINLELSRELNDANKRIAIQKWQSELEKERSTAGERIIELYRVATGKTIAPSQDDLLRYKLWNEQNQKELYEPTGLNIAITDIIGPDPAYDIEHTIPRSVSHDNSQANKTLCSKAFNREVKQNKMPSQLTQHHLEILERVAHWKQQAEDLTNQIEILVRKTKVASTKEQKDKLIQTRHYLTLKRDYWRDKYERFTMTEVKAGFKNSQLIDTGIITKYALAYLKTVFTKTYSIKGSMVAEFRKAWGLHDIEENEAKQKSYVPKDRSSHTHHCKDAITIACMTKATYDGMAEAWRLEEKGLYQDARKKLEKSKPWPTFSEDVRRIDEKVLVSHHLPNKMKKHSKKKLRIRGKIQTSSDGKPLYQQGDTARGSLHKEFVYGQIKVPETNGEIKTVIRRALSGLKASEVAKIVDPIVREKVESAVAKHGFKQVASSKVTVWMNEEKGIPIKKVRFYAQATSPIHLKEHRSVHLSRHEHKTHKLVVNDENYCMAIYEEEAPNGKIKRAFETIRNIDAAEFYKQSSKKNEKNQQVAPLIHPMKHYPLKYILQKGTMVIFYDHSAEEIWDLGKKELGQRLYRLAKFDAQGRLVFRPHYEARPASDLKEEYKVKYAEHQDQVVVAMSKIRALVEGVDFKLDILGRIVRI